MIEAKTTRKIVFLFTMLLCVPNVQAEARGSSNYKTLADGTASAINMDSNSFKLYSILGEGHAVKLSSSSKYKLGSSVVYVIGSRAAEDSLCFPIHLQNAKVAFVCF